MEVTDRLSIEDIQEILTSYKPDEHEYLDSFSFQMANQLIDTMRALDMANKSLADAGMFQITPNKDSDGLNCPWLDKETNDAITKCVDKATQP